MMLFPMINVEIVKKNTRSQHKANLLRRPEFSGFRGDFLFYYLTTGVANNMSPKIRPMLSSPSTGLASMALVIVIGFCGYRTAQATPITYIISAVGSGSLGGNSFSDVSFTITAAADTSQIFTNSPGILQVPDLSATISISGLGTATFNGTTNFVNQNEGGIGITGGSSSARGPGADILALENDAFDTYDLSSSIGPFSGSADYNPGFDFGTTAGNFVLNSVPGDTATFQATLQTVPEPATISLVGLGALALAIRRKRN